MKIVCPSCDATYEVPEKVATSRRKMRCARCASEWVPADALPLAAAPMADVAAAHETKAGMDETIPPLAAVPSLAAVREPATVADPEPVVVEPASAPATADPAVAPFEVEPAMDLPFSALVVVPPRPVTLRPEPQLPQGNATGFTQRGVPPPEKGAPVLAWGGSVAVLAAAVVAALVFRAPLMKAWPPSTRLYAAIGLNQP